MRASASPDPVPMGAMNTTPLIDVMLVLLIMFIVTVPMQSHVVKLDLPADRRLAVNPLKNKIIITERNQILWNGASVGKPELRDILGDVARMPVQPEVQFQPEATARYEIVDEVLAIAKRARVERMGFVGNDRYALF